ncbi:MAG: Ig-like domain-containing protein [Gemmatimonadota bacterium]
MALVEISAGNSTLLVGMSEQLTVSLKDARNNALSGRPVSWQSSNIALATVSTTGLVTATGPGPVMITATSEGKAGQASFTINPVPVATVSVTPATGNLGLGQTSQLSATPKDSAGHPLIGRVVTWSSSDTSAITISSGGTVTAAGLGSSTITATVEGKTGTSALTVVLTAVNSVTVTPPTASVQVGITTTLAATARDVGNTILTGRVIDWTSSAPAIATVDPNGVVTGVTMGSVTITAQSEGKSGTATVTVLAGDPASIVISPSPVTLVFGDSTQLSAVVRDIAGDTLSGQSVSWSSSDQGVAVVSPTGLVTSVTVGTAIITASHGGITTTDTVTVNPIPVASVAVSPQALHLGVGSEVQLSAVPEDSHGHAVLNRPITWSSSDSSVATVSSTGLVTGVAPGNVSIVAQSDSGNGASNIIVDPDVVATTIVSPGTSSVGAGLAVQLTAITLGSNGDTLPGRNITWSSSTPGIASVDSNGLVTGAVAGTTTINATSEGVSGSATITVVVNLAFPALDGGYAHTCSLTSTGGAYCWGLNLEGELGSGAFSTYSAVPVLVSGTSSFSGLYPGGKHTCALAQDGSAWCWGGNALGQLGRGDNLDSDVPAPVMGGLTFTAMTGGYSHACGLVASGAAYCWGSNSQGELGDGTTNPRNAPVLVSGNRIFVTLSARGSHTCGITANGTTVCWGRNSDGELGDGTTSNRSTPVAVIGGQSFTSITTGAAHTCALTAAGTAYCWGDNSQAELGDGSMTNHSAPTAVTGGLTFQSIRARGTHTCAISGGGVAYCWGRNAAGQLGDGTTTDRTAPVAVQGGLTFTDVSSGANFSCGVTNSALLYCWGDNSSGQLGDGTFVNRSTPVKVLGQP